MEPKGRTGLLVVFGLLWSVAQSRADVPTQINFQGKVEVPVSEQRRNTQAAVHSQAPAPSPSRLFPFNGTGLFRFAIVDGAGTLLWTNTPNSFTVPPPGEVSVQVKDGIFNVALGDVALGMPPITPDVFQGPDRLLRVFFRTQGQMVSTELHPVQKLLTVPFAFTAATAQNLATGATAQFAVLTVTTMTAASLSASSAAIDNLRVPQGIIVGSGTIFIGLTVEGMAPTNAITFDAPPGPAVGSILTTGGGAMPLTFDAGTAGIVRINPTSAGGVGVGLPAVGAAALTDPISRLHARTGDTAATAVTNVLTLDHSIPGAAVGANGIGTGLLFRAENSADVIENAAQINGVLTNAVAGAEVGALAFLTRTGAVGVTEKVRIDSAGNLGIGATAPTHKLDVAGGMILRSSLTLTGMAAPAISAAGQGAVYFDSIANKFKVSENGGVYVDMVSSTVVTSTSVAGANTGGGGDGSLTISANTTLDRAFLAGISPNAGFELHLNNFTVDPGVTLTIDAAVIIRCAGTVTINGNMTVNPLAVDGVVTIGGPVGAFLDAGNNGNGLGAGRGGTDSGAGGAGGGNAGRGGNGVWCSQKFEPRAKV